MRRRYQNLIGDPVRFLFVAIPRPINLEFGLQTKSLLFAALGAFSGQSRCSTAGTLALQQPWSAGRERGLLRGLNLGLNPLVHLNLLFPGLLLPTTLLCCPAFLCRLTSTLSNATK